MVSDFVEDWFASALKASAPALLHGEGILTPSVHFTVDFPQPARFGDRLLFRLWVSKVGRTSCDLRIEASLAGSPRMRMRQVLVLISAATGRAVPIPAPLVRRMRRFSLPASRRRAFPVR